MLLTIFVSMLIGATIMLVFVCALEPVYRYGIEIQCKERYEKQQEENPQTVVIKVLGQKNEIKLHKIKDKP